MLFEDFKLGQARVIPILPFEKAAFLETKMIRSTFDEIEKQASEEFKNRRIKRLIQVRKQSKDFSKGRVKSYRQFLEKDKKMIIEKYKKEFEMKKQREIEEIQREYELRAKNQYSEAHVEAQTVHKSNVKKAQDNFWTYMDAYNKKKKRFNNAFAKDKFSDQKKKYPKKVQAYRKDKIKYDEEMRRRDLFKNMKEVPEGMEKLSYELLAKYMKAVKARNPFVEISNPNERRKMMNNHYNNTFFHNRTKKHQKTSNNPDLLIESDLPKKRKNLCVENKRTFGHIVTFDDPEVYDERNKRNGVVTITRAQPDAKLRSKDMKMEVERMKTLRERGNEERKERYRRALERGRKAAEKIRKQKFEEGEKEMFDDMMKQDLQRRLKQIPLKIHKTISDKVDEGKQQKHLEKIFERKFLKK